MEIRLLGPVEVLSGHGPVPIGSVRQRALLAYLALRPHHLVTYDVLIDGLWGRDPPDEAVKALRFHVSRLRRILRQADADHTLRTRPGGYVLEVAEDAVDALCFEKAVVAARSAHAGGAAPDTVSRMLGDALDLWVGPALADISGEHLVVGECRRLEELRLAATEGYFASELAAGRHAEAIGELEQTVDANLLRERLWELWITALYRSGRQADALAAYQRLRRTLAEELGITPSEPLRKLEQSVLLQDAALAVPTAPRSAGHPVADETPVDLADEEAPPATAVVRPPRWLPRLALALGVAALGLVWLGVASTLIAGLAVVCGTVAVRRTAPAHMSVDRLAVAGLIVGAVAFGTSLGLLGYRDVSSGRDTVAGGDTVPGTQASPEEPARGKEVPISTLVVGDCIDLLPGTDPAIVPVSVLLVPCDQPHEQEVYHLFELAAGAYPGDQEVDALARDQCYAQFDDYVGIDPAWSGLDFIWVWPPRDTWEAGNRRGGCSLRDALGHALTGSMAGSQR